MEQWTVVRERRQAGESVPQIARELGIDRKTARRCLEQEAWRRYSRQAQGPTLLEAHRAWLVERAPPVVYSGRVLWQELHANFEMAAP